MHKHMRCVKMDAGASRDSEIELVFNSHLASGYEFYLAIPAGVHTIFVFTGDDRARVELQNLSTKQAAGQPMSVVIGPQGSIEQPHVPGHGPSHFVGADETVRQVEHRLLREGNAYVDAQGRTILGTPPGEGV